MSEKINLDFEIGNISFNARVSAIIYNKEKDKVLLFKINDGRDYYMLTGGRIEINEDSKSAIKREVKEELGWDLDFELCSIQENFAYKNNKLIMQYCFCYKAIYNEEIKEKQFLCNDNSSQIFYWIDLKKLDNYTIYPKASIELIKRSENDILHIIERQM